VKTAVVSTGVSMERLTQGRLVLHHSRSLADAVFPRRLHLHRARNATLRLAFLLWAYEEREQISTALSRYFSDFAFFGCH
jgi:hypothetical protein